MHICMYVGMYARTYVCMYGYRDGWVHVHDTGMDCDIYHTSKGCVLNNHCEDK